MLNDESRMLAPIEGDTRSAGERPGNMPEGTSEVARLRRLIAAEYEAAQRGLTGLSQGTAKHAFIEARMNGAGTYGEQLATLVGEPEQNHPIACAPCGQNLQDASRFVADERRAGPRTNR